MIQPRRSAENEEYIRQRNVGFLKKGGFDHVSKDVLFSNGLFHILFLSKQETTPFPKKGEKKDEYRDHK
jgi:hypothetical protein